MALYCWGSTINGELGLGGIEEEQILTPRELQWSGAADVQSIACGPDHTLFVNGNGQLFSCGCNDFGQLGHEQPRKRPQLVSALKDHVITRVACGKSHSLAVNEWGQLFAWGSNSMKQLGVDTAESQVSPKLVRTLGTKHVVQIALGNYHNLALTSDGDLYAWGSNSYGELGLGYFCENVAEPTLVSSIAGIPIALIACGGSHSFVLSKSGAVFGFGKNLFGQLGVNDERNREYPTKLKTLRNIGVRYIACGDDFSSFLTMDGGVFTCGLGAFGQLGHGAVNNEILPRVVMELMGTTCTQISCGQRHSLTFVPTRGRIYGFGMGCAGQLGTRNTKNSMFPQVVLGPWVSPGGSALVNIPSTQPPMQVSRIYSGGDHSFALTVDVTTNKDAVSGDYRIHEKSTQIASLSLEMAERMAQLAEHESVDLEFLSSVEQIFKSLPCMNASFLTKDNTHSGCSSRNPGVSIEQSETIFQNISRIENRSLKQIIWEGVTNNLIKSLIPSPADVEVLRIYLTLPIYHEFVNSKNFEKLHSPFINAVMGLRDVPLRIISNWWANQSVEYFERLVEIFKGVVLHIITIEMKKTTGTAMTAQYVNEGHLEMALRMIRLLSTMNDKHRTKRIACDAFYLPELMEYVDLQSDYANWIEGTNRGFNFRFHLCEYPFLFDVKAKTLLLQTDQAIQMQKAINQATSTGILRSLFSNQPQEISQFVVFNVTRDNLVTDTIREIMSYLPEELKKPLKVKFAGEEAEDAGGVRKEFFMILVKDLLDPKYGMFTEHEESRLIWFSEHTFESTDMFTLIGAICGLAIYNFTIVNIPFPLALYKKLLKEEVDINDLREMSPVVANSMTSLLNYDGDDIEDVFDLTFEISREVFGEVKTVPLQPGGEKIRVNKDNRAEFVNLYVDYIFNKSIAQQFESFYNGFMKVCGGNMMQLFKAQELMAVVVGNEDYDWQALQDNAQYKNGYSLGDQTIRWFWEVFHALPLEEKKKFLLFLTGSDRIPIEGMKAIKIYIQAVSDDKFLPVAHTCFNLLDLPLYKTKEKLKHKLLQAIQQTQGFSLV